MKRAVLWSPDLKQLRRQFPDSCPAFGSKIGRTSRTGCDAGHQPGQSATMQTLYRLVDMLSEWKINQLQLYTSTPSPTTITAKFGKTQVQ